MSMLSPSKPTLTCVSCSPSVGRLNRGVRPGTVGRKKGAAVGATGGAIGLFFFYTQNEKVCRQPVMTSHVFLFRTYSPLSHPGEADSSTETPAAVTASLTPPPADHMTYTHSAFPHPSPLLQLHPPRRLAAAPSQAGSPQAGGGAPQAHTDSYWS